jgi:hypothetical protein
MTKITVLGASGAHRTTDLVRLAHAPGRRLLWAGSRVSVRYRWHRAPVTNLSKRVNRIRSVIDTKLEYLR